jgi:hypothetical protein
LAKHCTEITLTPKGQTYQMSGDWNLFGGVSGGAGGPVRTMLPRSKFSTDQFSHRIGRMMVGKSLIQLGLRGADLN